MPQDGATFEVRAIEVLRRVEAGEIVTYGEVAAEAGSPGAGRAVGNILARSGDDVPWWRVVTSTGRLVPGHEREHAAGCDGRACRSSAGASDSGRAGWTTCPW